MSRISIRIAILFWCFQSCSMGAGSLTVGCGAKQFGTSGLDHEPLVNLTVSWSAPNATYVLIQGYDEAQHTNSGEIPASDSYIFIAVGEQGIEAKPVGCNF